MTPDDRWQMLVCDCGRTMAGKRFEARCPTCQTLPHVPVEVRLTEASALAVALRHLPRRTTPR